MTPPEPIAVASRVATLLETGQRVATYKLATMTALIDICVENNPSADGTLAVPLQEIAHRVIALYWRQTREYGEVGRLVQTRGGRGMTDAIADVRAELAQRRIFTAEAARELEDVSYARLARKITLWVARMPLTHLQTSAAGTQGGDFLFDRTGFHIDMTQRDIDRINHLVLRAGIADGLRHASTLLKTYIRVLWAQEVVNINRSELDRDDLEGFLFGFDRTGLAPLSNPLREIQNGRCFYCDTRLTSQVHIDHVLPWSVIPIDGVANLVATDQRCNLDKRASIPMREHVDRALCRDDLSTIAKQARFPLLQRRTASAAAGIYSALPQGSLLWRSKGTYDEHNPATGN